MSLKAAVNTYSHAPLSATPSDWAWRLADLSALRSIPLGAGGGAITGATYGKSLELEHGEMNAISQNSQLGAYIGAGLGAVYGAPGMVRYANDALKVLRAKSVGLNGNSIHSPTGVGDAWLAM